MLFILNLPVMFLLINLPSSVCLFSGSASNRQVWFAHSISPPKNFVYQIHHPATSAPSTHQRLWGASQILLPFHTSCATGVYKCTAGNINWQKTQMGSPAAAASTNARLLLSQMEGIFPLRTFPMSSSGDGSDWCRCASINADSTGTNKNFGCPTTYGKGQQINTNIVPRFSFSK